MTHEEYLLNVKRLQPTTVREYQKDLKSFRNWAAQWETGRQLDLRDLTIQIAEAWANAQAKDGIKANTINRRLSALASVTAWALHTGQRETDGLQGLQRQRRPKAAPKPADREAVQAYLSKPETTSEGKEIQALVALMATTGLRISEALSLRYSDIDKGHQALTVHGKGNKERRVYYTAATAEFLNRHADGRAHTGLIFDMDYTAAYQGITTSLKTGDRGTTPHQLRHLFATRQLEVGTDLFTLAAMMGHSDIDTTRRYTMVADSRARKAFLK